LIHLVRLQGFEVFDANHHGSQFPVTGDPDPFARLHGAPAPVRERYLPKTFTAGSHIVFTEFDEVLLERAEFVTLGVDDGFAFVFDDPIHLLRCQFGVFGKAITVAPQSMLRARAEGEADKRAQAEKQEAEKAAEGVGA